MNTYISFLRGINVGGHSIKMTDLKNSYESIGLTDVKTILQTGNVMFKSHETNQVLLQTKLEDLVSKKFSFNAKIFVVRREDLRLILNNYPFISSDDACQHYVLFMAPGIARILYEEGSNLKSDIDEIALGNDVIYWKVRKGMTVKSPFSKLLVKTGYKEFHTNRNIKTIAKLLS